MQHSRSDGTCKNCGRDTLLLLRQQMASVVPLATSDSGVLSGCEGTKYLCDACSIIQTTIEPADALDKYYAETYNATLQDYKIIYENAATSRHALVDSHFFASLDGLPERGSFLEIACGDGHLTNAFKTKNPVWECWGIDPSKSGIEIARQQGTGALFVQDRFPSPQFESMKFDIIVAHGFLNRSGQLPRLNDIRMHAKRDAIVSIEVAHLDYSYFVPYIWDHSFFSTQATFKSYLQHQGLLVRSEHDVVLNHHYICDMVDTNDKGVIPELPRSEIDRTKHLFEQFERFWLDIFDRVQHLNDSGQLASYNRVFLFGAGMHSHLLLLHTKLQAQTHIAAILDEHPAKIGQDFWGIPIVSPKDIQQQVSEEKAAVLVCTRPRYLEQLVDKLGAMGLDVIPLHDSTFG